MCLTVKHGKTDADVKQSWASVEGSAAHSHLLKCFIIQLNETWRGRLFQAITQNEYGSQRSWRSSSAANWRGNMWNTEVKLYTDAGTAAKANINIFSKSDNKENISVCILWDLRLHRVGFKIKSFWQEIKDLCLPKCLYFMTVGFYCWSFDLATKHHKSH